MYSSFQKANFFIFKNIVLSYSSGRMKDRLNSSPVRDKTRNISRKEMNLIFNIYKK